MRTIHCYGLPLESALRAYRVGGRFMCGVLLKLTGRSLSDPMDVMHVLLASQALDVVPVVSG